jgi:quinol monooxygenase YgiN
VKYTPVFAIAVAIAVAFAVLVAARPPAAGQGDPPPAGNVFERLATKLGPGEKPFAVVVRFKIKPGQERTFADVAAKTAAASRKEKGCVAYEGHRDLDDPAAFVFYEHWRSIAALKEHLQTDYTKAFLAATAVAAEGPPQVHFLAPLGDASGRPAK